MNHLARNPRLAVIGGDVARPVALNIGEVLSELNDEFPQVTASKIRFLEEKGLLTPQRTSAGYRKYLPDDVGRLRFILGLQRDQYLPLKIIKDYLDAVDRGEQPDQLPGGHTLAPRSISAQMTQDLAARTRPVTRAEMQGLCGASAELIEDLIGFGMIIPENDRFDEHAQNHRGGRCLGWTRHRTQAPAGFPCGSRPRGGPGRTRGGTPDEPPRRGLTCTGRRNRAGNQ